MLTIVQYKAQHLLDIEIQAGQSHDRALLTENHARAIESEIAATVMVDGRPMAVIGVFRIWEGRALLWSFIDHRAGPHFYAIHKFAKESLAVLPYRRIEAEVDCDFAAGHKWLKLLGFTMEAECMRAYRPDGGNSALYARVK